MIWFNFVIDDRWDY